MSTLKSTKTILTKDEIKEMMNYISEKVRENDCDGTLKYTKEWIVNKAKLKEIETILNELKDAGGYCDCEVLMNAADALLA